MSLSTPAPIAAVIFDHDGTLVDSEPVHLDCWRQVLLRFGSNLTGQDYAENLSGIPSIESARWMVRTFELPIEPDELYREKRQILHKLLEHSAFPLMRGAQALIAALANAAVPMAVASGATRVEVHSSIRHHELNAHFKTVVTSDDAKRNKPAPDIYLRAAEQLGIEPALCVAIEDSDSGERAAVAAGMRCLRLNTPSRLPSHTDRLIVEDLPHATDWLLSRITV